MEQRDAVLCKERATRGAPGTRTSARVWGVLCIIYRNLPEIRESKKFLEFFMNDDLPARTNMGCP